MRKTFAVSVSVVAALALGSLVAQQPSPPSADLPVQEGRPPGYNFVPFIQPDIINLGGAASFTGSVDNHAWALFVALNWPVPQQQGDDPVPNGVPDGNNFIGGRVTGGDGPRPKIAPTGPTVWQSWKDTNDIFLPSAAKPSGFDTDEIIPGPCSGMPDIDGPVLDMTAKVSEVLQSVHQAKPQVRLIAQNDTVVWYEVRVNRAWYDYVVDNGFYNSANQKGNTMSFPAGSNSGRGDGAMKVKAAWMELTDKAKEKYFYTTRAYLLDPDTQKCRAATMGLVGLHVVHKTATFQSWIWATFEHAFNAPDIDALTNKTVKDPPIGWNFYNPACSSCPVNTPPADTDKDPPPTQVVRMTPIGGVDSGLIPLNAAFTSALQRLRKDNVWQYYQLVGAQWGAPDGRPQDPQYLSNATMETYIQCNTDASNKPECSNVSGCMNCHSFAKTHDFDFQLSKAYPRQRLSAIQKAIDALDGPD